MKALLWKECHANLKWVVLPSLLILVPVVLLGGPGEPPTGMHLASLHILAAVFGAVLGFLQVFFEAHGDPRALLLHRPLSPSRIFLGKAVAGVGLYLLGMGIPIAALAVWCATPGHLYAPFSWPAVLPWLVDLLTGVVYYFAGMLTAQREGRWYGSRGLGLAAAFLATVLVWIVPEFWQALLALGVVGTLLGVAAWGSFLTGGAYGPQPLVARAALAVSLLAGLLVLSIAGKVVLGHCLQPGIQYSYILDRDGRVLLEQWQVGQWGGPLDSVTDLEGHVPQEFQGKRVDRNVLREIEAPRAALSTWTFRSRSYRNTGRVFVEYENETLVGDEEWFYVPDQGRLVGYDAKHRLPIGSYGPDGFVPAGEQTRERFPGELVYHTDLWEVLPPNCLTFAGGVYDIDFGRHTLQTLFTPPEGETVLVARRWKNPKLKQELLFVCTQKQIHVLTEAGAPVLAVPLAYDLESHAVSVSRVADPPRYVFWYGPGWFLDAEDYKTTPTHVVEYNADGREVGRRTLPPLPLQESSYAQALLGLGTPPAEIASLTAARRYLRWEGRSSKGKETWVLAELLEYWVPGLFPGAGLEASAPPGLVAGFVALMLLSAAASAAACFLLARRSTFALARTAGWSLCGLVFGPVGLLLLLALQALPARVRCPRCGRPRVVNRDHCEHCGAAHATPAPDGTEIFETNAAAADAGTGLHGPRRALRGLDRT
jgi:hypothetical protein